MEAGGIYWYLWGAWSGLEARDACLVEHTPGHVAWGEQRKGPAWDRAVERGTRQTSPPCPDLLQTGRATGGAGLNVRLDSLEEADD